MNLEHLGLVLGRAGGLLFPKNTVKAASQLPRVLRQHIPLMVGHLCIADSTYVAGMVEGVCSGNKYGRCAFGIS